MARARLAAALAALTLLTPPALGNGIPAKPATEASTRDAADYEGHAQAALSLAAYFAHGVAALANADLSALPPERRTPAFGAMARATLESGPKIGEIPPAPDASALPEGSAARKAAEAAAAASAAAREILLYLENAIVYRGDSSKGALDAAAFLARSERALASHGLTLAHAPFALGPMREELARMVSERRSALEEIAQSTDDPTNDAGMVVPVATRPEGLTHPAERALLALLVDSALSSPDTDLAVQAELIRGLAARTSAEGGLQAILRLKEDLGSSMTLEHAARAARIALASMRAISDHAQAASAGSAP